MIPIPDSGPGTAAIGLGGAALDRLMPMHLWLGPDGRVRHAGPTLTRLAGGAVQGLPFGAVMTLRRPHPAPDLGALLQLEGASLKLVLTGVPDLPLKGVVVALPEGAGALVDLSLGISLIEAVGRFDLTLRDFAPTDLAVELLYLTEAKAAVADELKRLALRLNGARASAEAEAATDTLTGLANRRGLDATLARMVRDRSPFALMHVDLDHFKAVNDTHGHAAGDAVLRQVAVVLRSQSRGRDLVARIGGDEFVIVFDEMVDPAQLRQIARRLITRLERPILVGDVPCRISASIGITLSTRHDPPDPDRLLQEADVALYESKRRGRARATLVSDRLLAVNPPVLPAAGA
ncbi:MAG: GGDEF domain-containing protein [Rhodobacteraceae bacterium]|nr:GGDEF domain-containing protein [Paracoccaceae bacterium]